MTAGQKIRFEVVHSRVPVCWLEIFGLANFSAAGIYPECKRAGDDLRAASAKASSSLLIQAMNPLFPRDAAGTWIFSLSASSSLKCRKSGLICLILVSCIDHRGFFFGWNVWFSLLFINILNAFASSWPSQLEHWFVRRKKKQQHQEQEQQQQQPSSGRNKLVSVSKWVVWKIFKPHQEAATSEECEWADNESNLLTIQQTVRKTAECASSVSVIQRSNQWFLAQANSSCFRKHCRAQSTRRKSNPKFEVNYPLPDVKQSRNSPIVLILLSRILFLATFIRPTDNQRNT